MSPHSAESLPRLAFQKHHPGFQRVPLGPGALQSRQPVCAVRASHSSMLNLSSFSHCGPFPGVTRAQDCSPHGQSVPPQTRALVSAGPTRPNGTRHFLLETSGPRAQLAHRRPLLFRMGASPALPAQQWHGTSLQPTAQAGTVGTIQTASLPLPTFNGAPKPASSTSEAPGSRPLLSVPPLPARTPLSHVRQFHSPSLAFLRNPCSSTLGHCSTPKPRSAPESCPVLLSPSPFHTVSQGPGFSITALAGSSASVHRSRKDQPGTQ